MFPDKIIIRQSDNYPLDSTHPPATLPSISACHRIVMRDAELLQIADTSTGILPLFPDHCSEPPEYPAVKRTEHTAGFSELKVVPPSTGILIHRIGDLRYASPSVLRDKFFYSLLKLPE